MNTSIWGERGNKVFWFKETESGNQRLIRPDGSSVLFKKRNAAFELSKQCHAGWQRAKLFMNEYGIWDATAFGCSMQALMSATDYEDGKRIIYLFSTCQHAERAVYPFLSEEQVYQCRDNVDKFYANPNIQAAWNNLILYPVCIKITEENQEFIPIAINDIGDGEQVLGNVMFGSVFSLENKAQIAELFANERCE